MYFNLINQFCRTIPDIDFHEYSLYVYIGNIYIYIYSLLILYSYALMGVVRYIYRERERGDTWTMLDAEYEANQDKNTVAENTIDPAKLSIAYCIDSDCQENAYQRPRAPVIHPLRRLQRSSAWLPGLLKSRTILTGSQTGR